MDTEELRKYIASGQLKIDDKTILIENGILINYLDESIPYEIHHGWNVVSAVECDEQWGAFTIDLLQFIKLQNYQDEQLQKVIDELHIEDSHWDWFNKSISYNSEEYNWFYIYAEGKPQGACLIYHPKQSLIEQNEVFYIEFVAAAPWNRPNPMQEREFSGVGTALIKCAINYAVNSLKLDYGFSLHSLPKAVGYYSKIGMINFEKMNKGSLSYFEMPKEKAKEIVEQL